MPVEMGTDNETVIIVKLPVSEASPAANSVASEKNGSCFSVDESVRIHGLSDQAAEQLNGQTGVIVSGGGAEERYRVRLEDGTVKSIKPSNLMRPAKTEPTDSPTSIDSFPDVSSDSSQ